MKFLAWSKGENCQSMDESPGSQGGNSFNRQSGVRTQMRVIAATEITFLETHAELAWHTINQGETIQCTQSRNQLNQTFSLENSLSLGAIVTGPGAELSRTGLGWAGLALKWLDLFHCVGVKLTWLTRRSFGYHHHRQQTAAGWQAVQVNRSQMVMEMEMEKSMQ